MTVYRIYQIVPIDVEGKDGPLVPLEGWTEQEVKQSQTGRIYVHKDCLHYCTEHRALFPPPPFSPSHPVFLHLSTLAKARSDEIRASAEEAVTQFIREKEDAVQRVESALKLEVEALWRGYTEANRNIQRERNTSRVELCRAPSGRADVAPALGTPVSAGVRTGQGLHVATFTPLIYAADIWLRLLSATPGLNSNAMQRTQILICLMLGGLLIVLARLELWSRLHRHRLFVSLSLLDLKAVQFFSSGLITRFSQYGRELSVLCGS
ncbi:hypothetical protein HGRIS_001082 [Hohenbuehelia grisea]|uniref:Uncharacterized protein n=1 Tax=Hohenbuehelia grisea TaxID=104357 RepID=A0ABR3JPG5_9AGAR